MQLTNEESTMKKYRNAVNKLRTDLYKDSDINQDYLPNLYNTTNIDMLIDLISKATSYRKLQELACCQELTTRQLAREERLEREIANIAELLNTKAEFHGDPRGHCVYLKKPGSKTFYNTFGGAETGYGISN